MTDHRTPPPDPDAQAAPDAGDRAVLDADIADWLNQAAATPATDEVSVARVKRRLLARVAEAQRSEHLTVQPGEGQWQPFGRGLSLKVLHEHDGVMSYLVRLAPGAVLPAHRHPIDEECVVLEGSLRIGELVVAAGGFHLGRRDVLHMPIVSEGGALIFLRGAAPEASTLL